MAATAEQFKAWLDKNPALKGTQEFADVEQAYAEAAAEERAAASAEPNSGPAYEKKRAALVGDANVADQKREKAWQNFNALRNVSGLVMGAGDIGMAAMRGGARAYEAGKSLVSDDTTPSNFRGFINDLSKTNEGKFAALSPEEAPEPTSFMGPGGARVAGSTLMTLPVGGALGQGAKAVGATRLGAALSSGGLSMPARIAPTVANKLADAGLRVAGGAAAGGAGGLLGSGGDTDAGLTGAAVGGTLGVGAGAAKYLAGSGLGRWVAETGSSMKDFATGNASNILNKITAEMVGERNLPSLIAAARGAPDILPGGKPTLSQAVAHLPEGSPLQALEKATATTPGGISGDFGARKAAQEAAIEGAKGVRKASADAQYGKAFAPNAAIKPDAELIDIFNNPHIRSVMKEADALSEAARLNPSKDLTKMLHNVKVSLDAKIKPQPGERALDNATRAQFVEAKDKLVKWIGARNSDYETARAGYAAASKPIQEFAERQALAENPLQKTLLGSSKTLTDDVRPQGPHIFNTKMAVFNYLTKATGRNIEREVDALAAARSLNPKEWAAAMEAFAGKGPTPERLAMEALRKKALAGSGKAAVNALAIGTKQENALEGAQ